MWNSSCLQLALPSRKKLSVTLIRKAFEDEMQPDLEDMRGYLTELGAVNVLTGEYTGRSPKDKFIVMDDTTRQFVVEWNGAKMIISPSPQKCGES